MTWEEYRQVHPDGYAYSRFCELYQRWRQQLDVVLRQDHAPGVKLFVDNAGATIPIHDPTGELERQASIFVAVLGASNYTYAEATASQALEHWISSHIRTFEFLGGCPKLVIPDNTRTGVNRACRYEPDLNRTYHELAMHYGVGVLPTRPYKPRDKAKVETGVQIVERWIVAALRHQKFFSLGNATRRSASYSINYNKRGTAEQWIKEGKQATHWTRLSCHRFRANEARLQLSLLAYNLGNLWRRLVLPKRIDAWSLTSLQQRLVKTGGRLIKHARYYWLLLAEGHLHRRLFGQMLRRIWALPVPNG